MEGKGMRKRGIFVWALVISFALSMVGGFTAVYADEPDSVMLVATPRTAASFNRGSMRYVVAIRDDGNLWIVELPFSFEGEQTVGQAFMIKENVVSVTVSGTSFTNYYVGYLYAITDDGILWRWGNDVRYRITAGGGLSNTGWGITIHEPPVVFKENVAFVVGGVGHSHAITTDGRLWSWGYNNWGQLGDGTIELRLEPVAIMDNVIQTGTSRSRAWAVTADGDYYVWGWDNGSHPGLWGCSAMYEPTPIRVMSGVRYATQSGDSATTFIIRDNGTLWGFGGSREALTGGHRAWEFVPIMDDVATIWAGWSVALATAADGSVWIWGEDFGLSLVGDYNIDQDANNLQTPVNAPVPVPLDVVAFIDDGTLYALTATGEIITWTRRTFPHPESASFPDPIIVMTIEVPPEDVKEPHPYNIEEPDTDEYAAPPTTRTLRFEINSTTFKDNSTTHNLEAAPFIANGRTMVPLRVIIEALGATDLSLTAGEVSFVLNGETITMTINQPLLEGMGTPVIVGGRTFVPLAYIASEMGATVRWDRSARAAYVYID